MPSYLTYTKRRQAGLCVHCGGPPMPGQVGCAACIERKRAYKRSYDGGKPWHPGGPGRRPVTEDRDRTEPQRLPAFIQRGRQRYGLPDAELVRIAG